MKAILFTLLVITSLTYGSTTQLIENNALSSATVQMPDFYAQGQDDVSKFAWFGCGFLGGWTTFIPAATMWATPPKYKLAGITGDSIFWASYDYREGAKKARVQSVLLGNLTRSAIALLTLAIDASTPSENPTLDIPITTYLIIIAF